MATADMENYETQTWLQFSLDCDYITDENHQQLIELSEEVGKLIEYMIQHPEKFARKNNNDKE
jgi:four helix bundle protein